MDGKPETREDHPRDTESARDRFLRDLANVDDVCKRQNMEREAAMLTGSSGQRSVNPQQVDLLFESAARLLESQDPDGVRLAQDIFDHATNGATIKQGKNSTCNVAAIQRLMFEVKPGQAAQMIAGAVLNDSVMTDTCLYLDADTISRQDPFRGADERSRASQIIQTELLQDVGQHADLNFKWEKSNVVECAIDKLFGATCERPVWAHALTGNIYNFGGLPLTAIEKEAQRVLGGSGWTMMYARMPEGSTPEAQAELKQASGGINLAASPDEVRDCLRKSDSEHHSMIVAVDGRTSVISGKEDATQPPFALNHVVTVRNFDPESDTVELTNQWNPEHNKRISIHELIRAMGG